MRTATATAVIASLTLAGVTALDSTLARNNMIAIALLLTASAWLIWRLRRSRRLVTTGERAAAQVTQSEIVGGKTKSLRIRYEFRDLAGRIWQGKCHGPVSDAGRTSLEVYYDPQRPQNHVAALAAFYQTTAEDPARL